MMKHIYVMFLGGNRMKKVRISLKILKMYERYLKEEEKSAATIEKYMRDVKALYEFLPEEKEVTKELLVDFKQGLIEKGYKTTSINSMLVAVNRFLDYINTPNYKIKLFKIQKKIFCDEGKELTKKEYDRLLSTAKANDDEKLCMLIQAICGTGIRVSEHRYITVEALNIGKATVYNKGKERVILISKDLAKMLLKYCKRNNIKSGPVFITKHGNPLDRSNVWTAMKKLCEKANVEVGKVFPHNLRHLFALTYYRLKRDLVGLASLLGHASIETTRGYTRTNEKECQRSLRKMELISVQY